MAIGRMIARSLFPLLLALALPASLLAQSVAPLQPVKRHPGPNDVNPFTVAQIQIARLRQTADQLRLLANQSVPRNLPGAARVELAQLERWLRQAEHRISVLADQWEERLRPLSSAQALGKAADLNAFFEAQSVALQSKLHRESLAYAPLSERVRSSRDTANLVIGKMYSGGG